MLRLLLVLGSHRPRGRALLSVLALPSVSRSATACTW